MRHAGALFFFLRIFMCGVGALRKDGGFVTLDWYMGFLALRALLHAGTGKTKLKLHLIATGGRSG